MKKKCFILLLTIFSSWSALVYGQATITIPKNGNKLILAKFDKKLDALDSFKIVNKRAKGSPKLVIDVKEGCAAKKFTLNVAEIDLDKERMVRSKDLQPDVKACFSGIPVTATIVLGNDTLTGTFAAIRVDDGNRGEVRKPEPGTAAVFTPGSDEQAKWNSAPDLGCGSAPPTLNKHTRWMLEYNFDCTDPVRVWKHKKNGTVVEQKRLRPMYDRNLLVTVKNFHPYRDSISIGVTYLDRFLEHATTFTSSFNTNMGLTEDEEEEAEDDSTAIAADAQDDSLAVIQLRDELKAFYKSVTGQSHVSVTYVEMSIRHINRKLTEVFGITDFSPQAIEDHLLEMVSLPKNDDSKAYRAIVREAVQHYKLIISYTIFDPHSLLIQNKDEITLQVHKFRNKQKVTIDPEANRSYNVGGGVKVDFSLGLFATHLIDRMYTTVSVAAPNDTTFHTTSNGILTDSIVSINRAVRRDSVLRDDRGKFGFGPAVFSHIYWRTGTPVNIGVTFGLSIDQQATPRYLFGGSLLIGTHQRVVISGGLAFGYRKELASGLKEGQKITLSTYPNSTLPTRDKSDTSGFVAISFNFGGFGIGNARP